MTHTEETKRRIGEAAKARGSAAIALAAKVAKKTEWCSVDGCQREHEAKGLCNMHYLRFRIKGSVGAAGPIHSGDGGVDSYGSAMQKGERVHVLVAEAVFGRKLPVGAIVHHVNEDKDDNRKSNLVICPDRAYHNLIHARMRALDACGNVGWMLCPFCGKYDSPANLYVYPNRRAAKHVACFKAYRAGRSAEMMASECSPSA